MTAKRPALTAIQKARKAAGILKTLVRRRKELTQLQKEKVNEMALAEYHHRTAHFIEHP
jgi:hypothetical protein